MQTSFPPERLADSHMAASEKIIRKCVHCGFCASGCPTFDLLGDELDSPRGRIYLMKTMLETGATPTPNVVKHIDRCLSCLSCATSCPSGVDYGHLVDHGRAYIEQHYRRPFGQLLLRALLAGTLPHPRRFRLALKLAALGRPFAPLFERIAPLRPLAAMLALAPRHLPAPPAAGPAVVPAPQGRVALLQGCAEPVLRPDIRSATLRLLARCGHDVILAPGEGCCGSLVHHMGRETQALDAARRNVDAWIAQMEGAGLDAILVTVSGCGSTIKDYGHMLRDDPAYADKAARVSAIALDISEYLARIPLPPVSTAPTITVAWHPPCSLQHGQKVIDAPLRLLRAAGFTVRTPANAHLCCGSAGTYNMLQPELARQLGARKAAAIERLAPDVVATGNIGCMTQIELHSGLPTVHLVELLDWVTGGPRPAALSSDPG